MTTLSGIKDVNIHILSQLDDKTLLETFIAGKYNKEIHKIYSDESFWKNRFISKYGLEASKYKPVNRSWRDHYLHVIIDLERFAAIPMQFFDSILWRENVNHSYYIHPEIIPLLKTPEYVLNNLYLFDIKNLTLAETEWYEEQYFEHITPFQLLNFIMNKITGTAVGILGFTFEIKNGKIQYIPLTFSKYPFSYGQFVGVGNKLEYKSDKLVLNLSRREDKYV